MHYLQTVVTTLQAVMPISQPGAFHCVTKTVARVARPSLRMLVMQYAIHPAVWREWSGSRDYILFYMIVCSMVLNKN